MSDEQTAPAWQFWIDRGGRFTDIVARKPDGALATHKLLSDNPEQYRDAALAGIRDLLGVARDAPIPVERIDAVKMGTTVATNALLERKGEPTVLFITRGFGDALRIAYQNRPRLFDRHIVLPEMLYSKVIEVEERVGARGEVVLPLDAGAAKADLQAAYADGYRSIAIVFMHGYRFTAHEQRVAELASDVGFTQISVSHRVSPLMKLVGRGDTTVVDAYLSPILGRYVRQVASELEGVRLFFMQSNGGLADARRFQGKDAILSGPAGGIVGAARTAEAAGFERIIGFDMGGTSTDVYHYAGEFEREFETHVAGVRMRAPMMSIHSGAAGGGSILHFDGARYRVGPDSAGANPGPACYRRGGPLTVTDANLMLGKIQPGYFPQVFGADGNQPLDCASVKTKFSELTAQIADGRSPEQVAAGFIQIAVGNMANAIKHISVQRVHDVTGTELIVALGTIADMVARFEAAYRKQFSFLMPGKPLIVEAVSVEAIAPGEVHEEGKIGESSDAKPVETVRMFTLGEWRAAPLYRREDLGPGKRIQGPAIIAEAHATTVVEPEWQALVTALNHVVLERSKPRETRAALGTSVDPVMLEIFNSLYMSIAEQMGLRLQNTAYSVNIKERLDFSCALFDAEGNLIANAPHMPVHLGSMGESVKTVIRLNAGNMKPGNVYVLNAPYNGGTHLPDVTVITPVFGAEKEILFYVGSRGHHADI